MSQYAEGCGTNSAAQQNVPLHSVKHIQEHGKFCHTGKICAKICAMPLYNTKHCAQLWIFKPWGLFMTTKLKITIKY